MFTLTKMGCVSSVPAISLTAPGIFWAGTAFLPASTGRDVANSFRGTAASIQQSAGRFAANPRALWYGVNPAVDFGILPQWDVSNDNATMICGSASTDGNPAGVPPVPPNAGTPGGDGDGDDDDWVKRWERKFRNAAGSSRSRIEPRTLQQIKSKVGGLPTALRRASLSGMLSVYRRSVGKPEPWTYTMDWFDWSTAYYKSAVESLETLLATLDPDESQIDDLRTRVIDGLSRIRLSSQSKGYRHVAHRRDVGRLLWKLLGEDDVGEADVLSYFRHMNNIGDSSWGEILELSTPGDLLSAPQPIQDLAIRIRDRHLRDRAVDVIEKSRTYASPSKAAKAMIDYSTAVQVASLNAMFERGHDVAPHMSRLYGRLVRYYEKETKQVAEGDMLPAAVRDDLLHHIALRIVENRNSPSLWAYMVYGRTKYLIEANRILNELFSEITAERARGIRTAVLQSLFDDEIKYKRLRGRVYRFYRMYSA